MSADAQLEALGGEPLVCEVGPEGERADLVVAAVALGGEARNERCGFGAVGAGGMPAAVLLAGDGVEPFVDDGVVAVSLAGDVSLRGGSSCSSGSGRSGTR